MSTTHLQVIRWNHPFGVAGGSEEALGGPTSLPVSQDVTAHQQCNDSCFHSGKSWSCVPVKPIFSRQVLFRDLYLRKIDFFFFFAWNAWNQRWEPFFPSGWASQAITICSIFRLVFERMPQNSRVCSNFSPLEMHVPRRRSLSPPISTLPSLLRTGFPERATNSGSLAVLHEDTPVHLCSQLSCWRGNFSFYVQAQTGLAVWFFFPRNTSLFCFRASSCSKANSLYSFAISPAELATCCHGQIFMRCYETRNS